MGCPIHVPTPTSLKEALELLDVMSKSVNGSERGVKTVFERKLDNSMAAFDNFQLALNNASELRARIVGFGRVSKYGSYGHLKSYGNDYHCGLVIVDILKDLLPKLIKTLEFLLEKVKSISDNHWGGHKCNGDPNHGFLHIQGSAGKELHMWLIDQNSNSSDYLKRGYSPYELTAHTGDAFKAFLEKLVKPGQNSLEKLHASIKTIATYGLQRHVNLSRSPSHDASSRGSNGGSGEYSSYVLHSQPSEPTQSRERPSTPPPPPPRASSQGPPQDNQRIGYTPSETQPSPTNGDSSTATIGGAVGATGLVGGGAAVYFLNIGGIRTLIAG
ncbi:uncharacterized protein BcabD6B2_46010 [Babesia caballi]|uniref:Uncharacterized protein n=1 Tax=Babesia caballi TaxID=5871 RepID=A0AAV4LZA4_BABCB|nr:hypothetical protein, conserved [Babesia caballi]